MIDELHRLLLYHYNKYPEMQIVDFFKLLYQNEFGCGHLIPDGGGSLSMILEEAAGLSRKPREREVVEPIGNGLCRLYLSALQDGLAAETLNRFFVVTANRRQGDAAGFEAKAVAFKRLCEDGRLPFDAAEVARTIEAYRAAGYPAMRHSPRYRRAYAPAYRVVGQSFCDFLALFCRIDALMREKSRVVCAIDGGCASGKTTLAALLKSVYGCNVFSMDDFFLRPFQRTTERLSEPGGNVDYERFGAQVLQPLLIGRPFAYRPYDCATQKLTDALAVQPHPLNIVEGVYSLHPSLAEAYDLKVFLKISGEAQKRRLMRRSEGMYDRFVQTWIPMEKDYFSAYQVSDQCDLVFEV